jgi:hypothetical protein
MIELQLDRLFGQDIRLMLRGLRLGRYAFLLSVIRLLSPQPQCPTKQVRGDTKRNNDDGDFEQALDLVSRRAIRRH